MAELYFCKCLNSRIRVTPDQEIDLYSSIEPDVLPPLIVQYFRTSFELKKLLIASTSIAGFQTVTIQSLFV